MSGDRTVVTHGILYITKSWCSNLTQSHTLTLYRTHSHPVSPSHSHRYLYIYVPLSLCPPPPLSLSLPLSLSPTLTLTLTLTLNICSLFSPIHILTYLTLPINVLRIELILSNNPSYFSMTEDLGIDKADLSMSLTVMFNAAQCRIITGKEAYGHI